MVKPKMVNTMAGDSSFVCRLVNVVHRDRNATGRDGYDTFILMLFGASLEVDRSLDTQISEGLSKTERLHITYGDIYSWSIRSQNMYPRRP
jgi:hypothetical protein